MTTRSLTLRVNLLEQCQLSCGYCQPGSLRRPTPSAERLTPREYERLGRLFARAGVTRVRFTGGEPLLRPDFDPVLEAFSSGMPRAQLALTTNGQRLSELLARPAVRHLHAVTVHVDSLRGDRYRALMGDGAPETPLAAALQAKARGLLTKLNVVVQRARNDDELGDLLAWSHATGIEVRFIELMNTGSATAYAQRHFISGAEVLAAIGAKTSWTAEGRRAPADPAALYRLGNGVRFGVIASDTAPFCGACTRLRLSPAGALRGCLYQPDGVALGARLRAGDSDLQLEALLASAVVTKQSHHPTQRAARVAFSMADIGG